MKPLHRSLVILLEVCVLAIMLDQNSCNRLQFSFGVVLVLPRSRTFHDRRWNNAFTNPTLECKHCLAESNSSFRNGVYLMHLEHLLPIDSYVDFFICAALK